MQTWEPCEAPAAVLKDVHDAEYLKQLHTSSRKVASVIELPPLAVLPMWLLQRMLLNNMRRHMAGTMLAAGLAVQHGWSLNIGGGMHHARHNDGALHHLPTTAANDPCGTGMDTLTFCEAGLHFIRLGGSGDSGDARAPLSRDMCP